jgi:TRAP-type C4-dicarboxylate transport system permease small subunit
LPFRALPLSRVLEWLAGATLFALMLVVSVDVTGRYLFNRPLSAGYEMVQVLMGVLVFTALPLVSRTNEHLSLGLLDHRFRGRANRLRLAFVNAVSAGVLGFLTWRLWAHAGKLAANRDATPVLGFPLAPVAYFMVVLSAVSVVLLVVLAFKPSKEP